MLSVLSFGINAQNLKKAKFDFLKSEENVNVVFDYSNVIVDGMDEEFLDSHINTLFYFQGVTKYVETTYTIRIKVENIATGEIKGPFSEDPAVGLTISFVETATENVLVTGKMREDSNVFGGIKRRVTTAFMDAGDRTAELMSCVGALSVFFVLL
jgi:hypothetical protein